MASFTLELWEVIELTRGTTELVDGNTIMTGGNIGLGSYPIFDEAHRKILNGKIIDRYYNREIGMETIDMFQLAVRRKMNEIMPAYNELYESKLIEFDALSTVNIKTLTKGESTQNQTAENTSDNTGAVVAKSRTVGSDTPQVQLSDIEDYATTLTDSNSDTTSASNQKDLTTSDGEATSNGESSTTGYQGSASALLAAFRANIVNVDLLIVDELAECFMSVWDTGDSYSERGYY